MPIVRCPYCEQPVFARQPRTVCEKCGKDFAPFGEGDQSRDLDDSEFPWHRTARLCYQVTALAVPCIAAIGLYFYLRTALEGTKNGASNTIVFPFLALVVLGALGGAVAYWGIEFSEESKRRRALGLKKIWFGLPVFVLGLIGFVGVVAFRVANDTELAGAVKLVANVAQYAFLIISCSGFAVLAYGLAELVSGQGLGFNFDATIISFVDRHRDDEDTAGL